MENKNEPEIIWMLNAQLYEPTPLCPSDAIHTHCCVFSVAKIMRSGHHCWQDHCMDEAELTTHVFSGILFRVSAPKTSTVL